MSLLPKRLCYACVGGSRRHLAARMHACPFLHTVGARIDFNWFFAVVKDMQFLFGLDVYELLNGCVDLS